MIGILEASYLPSSVVKIFHEARCIVRHLPDKQSSWIRCHVEIIVRVVSRLTHERKPL